MVEPSQIIVQKWFEMEGYFLQTNVKFRVPRGYSDIDIIGLNAHGEGLVVEVKSWGQQDIGIKEGKYWIRRLSSNSALLQSIERTLGKRKIKRVLVLARVGKRSISELLDFAKTRNVEILTIDIILKKMIQRLPVEPAYDSEVLQVLRMLKVYQKIGKVRISFP